MRQKAGRGEPGGGGGGPGPRPPVPCRAPGPPSSRPGVFGAVSLMVQPQHPHPTHPPREPLCTPTPAASARTVLLEKCNFVTAAGVRPAPASTQEPPPGRTSPGPWWAWPGEAAGHPCGQATLQAHTIHEPLSLSPARCPPCSRENGAPQPAPPAHWIRGLRGRLLACPASVSLPATHGAAAGRQGPG